MTHQARYGCKVHFGSSFADRAASHSAGSPGNLTDPSRSRLQQTSSAQALCGAQPGQTCDGSPARLSPPHGSSFLQAYRSSERLEGRLRREIDYNPCVRLRHVPGQSEGMRPAHEPSTEVKVSPEVRTNTVTLMGITGAIPHWPCAITCELLQAAPPRSHTHAHTYLAPHSFPLARSHGKLCQP